MRVSTLKLFFIDALKSLKRNKTISTAAAATVAATLFILGICLLVLLNVRTGISDVRSKVQVQVYFKDDITIDQQKDVLDKLTKTSGITSIKFESKSDALSKFKNQLGSENKSLIEGMDRNPMPTSYVVSVSDADYASNVVKALKNKNGGTLDGIEKVQDGRELINKITTITSTVQGVGIAIFIILAGVSLFLIGNTIKLTVYSRRREIGIMKYIGATDWFIRFPFIIEGMIIGIVGSVITIIVTYNLYKVAYNKMNSSFLTMNIVSPSYVLVFMSWEFILAGMFIGALGSIVVIRKFLDV
ncbi:MULTISPECIES: permease-like cell division protein FtsX [Clostridium]|uniref:permease-like cell division protein FtsX n=1 Tax=Clostridium TaxID=1485 RepID=UPI0008261B89|nr:MULTISPECIES: permease-like cell division protein FtsX [Clostridium]PJI07849.1 ABC transporter permease [Clostridium sp. CT7]